MLEVFLSFGFVFSVIGVGKKFFVFECCVVVCVLGFVFVSAFVLGCV